MNNILCALGDHSIEFAVISMGLITICLTRNPNDTYSFVSLWFGFVLLVIGFISISIGRKVKK